MCYAEVDFVTTGDERLVRNKIVGALKTQIGTLRYGTARL